MSGSFIPIRPFSSLEICASAPNTMPQMRARCGNGHYELRNATAADLIRTAWGVEADGISGGPDWLDLNRHDLIGIAPTTARPEMLKTMLQSALKTAFSFRSVTAIQTISPMRLQSKRNLNSSRRKGPRPGGASFNQFRQCLAALQNPFQRSGGFRLRVRLSADGSHRTRRHVEF
jgi:hypothetical protein